MSYAAERRENQRQYGTPSPSPEAKAAIDRERERTRRTMEEAAARRRRAFERDVKQRYLAAGGTEADWERERDEALKAARLAAAASGDHAARVASARRYG